MPRVLLNTTLIVVTLFQFVLGCFKESDCVGLFEICKNRECECINNLQRAPNGVCSEHGMCMSESKDNNTSLVYIALAALFAVLIFASLIIIIVILYQYRRNTYPLEENIEANGGEGQQTRTLKHKPSIRKILGEYKEPNYSHYDNPSTSLEDFTRLAQSLREDASVFLQMINEVKQKLHMTKDPNTTQATQYKSLIRDISRVLQLLNKDQQDLEMPADGVPLLLWAEHALKRFEYEELQNPIRDPNVYGECSNRNLNDAVL